MTIKQILAGCFVALIALIVGVLLTGCSTVDPRKSAEAYATQSQADQLARDATQEREQKAILDAIAVKDAERTQAIKDAAMVNAKAVYGWMTLWGGITLTIVLVYVLISIGRGLNVVIQGTGEAMARAAMVKANLIYLDKTTGQYPLVLEYAGKGLVSLTDPNTNTTLLLNTRNEPDRMMIQTAGAIRHVGVLSAAASRSKDPAGVSMIQPMIIDQSVEVS
jgi:hypothetical protein